MTHLIEVTLSVVVTDPQRLWRQAHDHLTLAGIETPEDSIGTEDDPDPENCLRMLLDRNEHLDGAEIEDSTATTLSVATED